MKILAFDTSSTALSVALLEDENLVAEATVTVKKNHSISLMPTIDFLVAQASWQPADLDRIVVAQGPGSYTGLRVAVATAKTLAYALDIDLVGVSSLQALTNLSVDGVVIPIMDARRNNVYVGFYKNGQAIVPDCHAAFTDVLEQAKTFENVTFVGEVVNFVDQIKEAPVTIALFMDKDLTKRARKIARVAGVRNFSDEQLQFYMQNLPAEFARYSDQQKSDYLALNAGLVAMNLVLALTDQGIGSNIILGFDKSKANEVLDIEDRFRPELLITVGYTDEKLEPSYRLPVDEIIEKR